MLNDAASSLVQTLLSTQTPWLPALGLLRYARLASWALVLVFLVLWLGRHWPRWVRAVVLIGLLARMVAPGPWSPAWWLGLAFQMPSLTTTALCLVGVLLWWCGASFDLLEAGRGRVWRGASWAGIALGWLLLLDTFAGFPISLYAWGFSALALGFVAAAALLPWIVLGTRHGAHGVALLLGSVLLLFVLLRLPNGNVWSALLDPLLWLVLQGYWVVRGLRWLRARGATATRAGTAIAADTRDSGA